MRLCVVLALLTAGCFDPFDGDRRELSDAATEDADGGLRDGEMPENVAQEWCWRWICEGHRGEIRQVSCGGLDEYDCR